MALIDKNQYLQLRNQGLSKEEAVARLTTQEPQQESGWSSVRIPEAPHFTQEEMGQASPIGAAGMWAGNIGAGALNIAGGVGNIALHPIETASTIGKVGGGLIDIARGADTQNKDFAKKAIGTVVDKYTSLDEFKKSLAEDPLSIVGDIATVVSAGAGAVSKGAQVAKMSKVSEFAKMRELGMASEAAQAAESARKLSKIQQAAGNVARIGLKVDPYAQIPVLGAKAIGKTVGGAAGFAKKSGLYLLAQKSGLNPETIETITKAPQMFERAQEGSITRESFGEKLHGVLETKIQDLGETGAQYEPIRKSKIVVENPIKQVEEGLAKKGILAKDGVLDFSSSNVGAKTDRSAIQGAYDILKETPALASANDILNLRQKLDGVIHWSAQTSKKGEEIVRGVIRRTVDDIAKEKITGLKAVDDAYSPKIAELKDLQKEWFTKTPSGDIQLKPGAVSAIANLYKKGREGKLARLEQYLPGVGKEVKALAALEDTLNVQKVGAYTRGAGTGIGAIAGVATGGPAGALAGIAYGLVADIMTSPTVIVPILKAYGKTKIALNSTIDSAINKIGKGTKLNQAEKTVVKEAVKTKEAKDIVDSRIKPKGSDVSPTTTPSTPPTPPAPPMPPSSPKTSVPPPPTPPTKPTIKPSETVGKGLEPKPEQSNKGGIANVKPENQAKYNQGTGYKPVRLVLNTSDSLISEYGAKITRSIKSSSADVGGPSLEYVQKKTGLTVDQIIDRSKELKDIAKQYRDKDIEKVIDLTSGKPVDITKGKVEPKPTKSILDNVIEFIDSDKFGILEKKFASKLEALSSLNKLPVGFMPVQNPDGTWSIVIVPRIGRLIGKGKMKTEGKNIGIGARFQGEGSSMSLPEKSLIEEARKYKSAEEFVEKGFTHKPPKKLYRGVAEEIDKSKRTELGFASLGKGFYTTPDKNFAKKYGKVEEFDPIYAFPRNPLVIERPFGPAPGALKNWLLDKTGLKTISEFHKKYGEDYSEFLQSQGYDGAVIGDEVVKYGGKKTDLQIKDELRNIYNKAHNK